MWRNAVIVAAASPIRVHHERCLAVSNAHHCESVPLKHTLPLCVPHSDAVRVAAGATTDADNATDPLREKVTCSETLHAAHARSNTCVQLLDAQVVQQSKLRPYHILHCQNWEPCRIALATRRVDR